MDIDLLGRLVCSHGKLQKEVQELEQQFRALKLDSVLRALKGSLYLNGLPTDAKSDFNEWLKKTISDVRSTESSGTSQVEALNKEISLYLRTKLKLTEVLDWKSWCRQLTVENMWLLDELMEENMWLLEEVKLLSQELRSHKQLPIESYPDQNNGISLPSKEAEVKEISDATSDKDKMMKLIEKDPKRCYQMLEEKNRWLRGEIDLIKDEFSNRNFDKLLEELELSLWVPTESYPDQNKGISLPSREAEVKEISDATCNKHESYPDQNEWISLPSREIEAKEISDAISNKQRMIELIEEDPRTCYQHLFQENMRLSEELETVRDEFKAHNLHTLLIELELSLHLNDYELPKDCS